jgi:uncharacterized protein YcfJ
MGGAIGEVVSVVAGPIIGGLIGNKGSKDAANTQAAAAQQAGDLSYQIFQEQKALQEPFREAGLTAQNRLLDLLGLSKNTNAAGYGSLMRDFGQQDFQQDPGYAFRLSEGLKALDRQAAARGGLISGAALKASQRYGQDMASQEYQNAFNRFQINRANKLTPLQSLTGGSQTAANTISNAAGQYGQAGGEAIQNAAAARASGYVGGANALTNAIGQGFNMYQQNQMFNRLFPGG